MHLASEAFEIIGSVDSTLLTVGTPVRAETRHDMPRNLPDTQ